VNILLTGSSGFIGKNTKEYFSDKYQLFAPSHNELDLLNDNIVHDFFTKHNIDVVIHSAVKPGHRNAKDRSGLFYSNTRMYYNLAQQSKNFGKMIVLGSGAIYDTRNNIHKVSEDSYKNHLPEDDHGFCKYICARDIEHMDNIMELRLFGVFGKYEDYAIRFISNAICKILFDLPITIKQNRLFDYLYIDDLMPVLDYFINNDAKQKAYNITPDKEIELYQLAEIVGEISGKDLPIIVSNPGMGKEYSGDNILLRNELREVTFTPIHSAIEHLFSWYSNNLNLISKDLLLFDK
jgi:UDP-glucose 4-epimerase